MFFETHRKSQTGYLTTDRRRIPISLGDLPYIPVLFAIHLLEADYDSGDILYPSTPAKTYD